MKRKRFTNWARLGCTRFAFVTLVGAFAFMPLAPAVAAEPQAIAAQSMPVQSDGALAVAAVGTATHRATRTSLNQRRITDLIGSNGWPGSEEDVVVWKNMGLRWGRDSAWPDAKSPYGPFNVTKSGPGNADLPSTILRNNRNGIRSLIYLGYTPIWNARVPGDSLSAPKEVSYWEKYVETVVKKYSAPPYNVKYFQIWNEACGEMANGLRQASFWHGPEHRNSPADSKPYADAMQDYVNLIHIPAARIIRKYHGYVVYGGWPDQGGLDNYFTWLEYYSPEQHAKMIDWVDYLDIHYLGVKDIETLYRRYGTSGKIRGIWQTEIGNDYLRNQNYLPEYYFDLAVWALRRNWSDPNMYVTMVYHWDGLLTNRGRPRTYTPSGRALITLTRNVSGVLAPFDHTVKYSQDLSVKALYSDNKIVFQVVGKKGRKTIDVTDIPAPPARRFEAIYIDAVEGTTVRDADLVSSWQGDTLSLQFNVPGPKKDLDGKPRDYLGYVVVTPLPEE